MEPVLLEKGLAELRSLGFTIRTTSGVFERDGFTAGTRETRLRELQELFLSDEVAGIVCARGGAGSARLLRSLDPAVFFSNPKAFVGYSDITFLHLYLCRLGLVTFYGPMVAKELAEGSYDRESFLDTLTGQAPRTNFGDLRSLNSGTAEGRLLGGCLSLVAAAAGTPWALAADEDVILFLEDRDEPPYRIDRMLFQLGSSGAFSQVKGIVFGQMPGCSPDPESGYSLESVILAALAHLDIPVAIGLPAGHAVSPGLTLPLGVRARLSCNGHAQLELLESAVA